MLSYKERMSISISVMDTYVDKGTKTAGAYALDGAVGVPAVHWYVAIVNHNSERMAASRLGAMGYECYVASQSEMRVGRDGRRRAVDRVVIPSMLFIRCSEARRLVAVNTPYIYRFLTNKAGRPNAYGKPVAIVPDGEMARLRFMLGNSERPVEFVEPTYHVGDKVRVVRGPLRGLEGEVETAEDGASYLCVNFPLFGMARTRIEPIDIEHI